jgi:hypothetical protein
MFFRNGKVTDFSDTVKFSSVNFAFPEEFEMSVPDNEPTSDKLGLCFVVTL